MSWHTFASHLAQRGANFAAVQGLLGHSDIRTTMRYAHINQAVLREAIGILDGDQQFISEKIVTIASQSRLSRSKSAT